MLGKGDGAEKGVWLGSHDGPRETWKTQDAGKRLRWVMGHRTGERGGDGKGATSARRMKRSPDGLRSRGPAPQGCWRPDGVSTRDEGWNGATQQPLGVGKPQNAGSGPVTGCGKGDQGVGWQTESTKQQPRGIAKPVAIEW